MRLRKSVAAAVLLCFGLLFCAGNVWFTAVRSTIPRSMNGTVIKKSIGREKHAGLDDVYWLLLDSGEKLHVDPQVFNAVNQGEHVRKEAWSRELHHGSTTLTLEWSSDLRGMLWGMSAAAGVILLLTAAIKRKRKEVLSV